LDYEAETLANTSEMQLPLNAKEAIATSIDKNSTTT